MSRPGRAAFSFFRTMKKCIALLWTVALTQTLSAQQCRYVGVESPRIDLQAVQHIGLNPWSNADYVNDGFPAASLTEFRGVFNLYLTDLHFGLFMDMGLGVMPAAGMKSFSLERMPMPHDGTQYSLREMTSQSGSGKTSAHFKVTCGLFGKIVTKENFTVMPYFGIGVLPMSQRRYKMILEEEGSDRQYQTTYIWNGNAHGYHTSPGYLTGRLNFKYKLSPKSNLLLGVEYTWFMNTLDFYGQYVNTIDAAERDFTVKGNKMNMLGLSVGVSFM